MTADISGVLANLAEMGRRTAVKLLSFDYVPAEGVVAQALGVAAASDAATLGARAFGRRLAVLLPHHARSRERFSDVQPSRNWRSRPLLELLERAGVKVEHARQRISAGLATPDVAEALGLHIGSPLIELIRVVYDQAGRGVEHLHALYRPDRYAFEIDLVRSGAADTKAWSPVVRRARAASVPSSHAREP